MYLSLGAQGAWQADMLRVNSLSVLQAVYICAPSLHKFLNYSLINQPSASRDRDNRG